MGNKETARPRLFGTDGVRGIANVEPMTSEIGAAPRARRRARASSAAARRHKIIIGKDTRLSGYMLESALTSGICSMGVDVLAGAARCRRPGIAFLTRSMRADAGVMISASHNPFQDNGIKFFAATASSSPDDVEREIERSRARQRHRRRCARPADEVGKAFRIDDALGRYIVFLKKTFPRQTHARRPDASWSIARNGAGLPGRTGGARRARRDGHRRSASSPTATNINDDCGALHPQELAATRARRRRRTSASRSTATPIASSSSTSRATWSTATRCWRCSASTCTAAGACRPPTVVATVMSNLGLELALRAHGIALVRVQVGDRYVVEEMVRGGYKLGGEQSGHIVFLDHGTTGDGLVTALSVLAPDGRDAAGRSASCAASCDACRSAWSTCACASDASWRRCRPCSA